MPNQLSKFKQRASLAEHGVVLTAVSALAQAKKTTAMDVLRQATRAYVCREAARPEFGAELQTLAEAWAPRMPKRFRTAAQVARFKRHQREYDQVLLDLGLASPAMIQERNSIVSPQAPIRMVDFGTAYAEAER